MKSVKTISRRLMLKIISLLPVLSVGKVANVMAAQTGAIIADVKGKKAVMRFNSNKEIQELQLIKDNEKGSMLTEANIYFDTQKNARQVVMNQYVTHLSVLDSPVQPVLRIRDNIITMKMYSGIVIGDPCTEVGNGLCIYPTRCIFCYVCSNECEAEAITIDENTPSMCLTIDASKCTSCYGCAYTCPCDSIVLC